MARVLRIACLLALPAAALAQQPLGATFGTQASTASRGALLGAAGTLVARFDHDDLVGWGCTTSAPNRRAVRGVTFAAEDKNGATPESWSLAMFTEDPAQPGYPAIATPLVVAGPFTNPTRPAGVAVFQHTHVFAAPVLVPADRDVFVGVRLGPAPAWPADGLTVHCLLGAPSAWPLYDAPGPAPIQHGSYGLAIDSGGNRYYNSVRQLLVDLLCDAPGGACTAISNQASFAPGAVPPGAGGFLSALHPDAAQPPRNAGRADQPGFVFLDPTLPNGAPVLFAFDIGSFGVETRLDAFVPGSAGVFCLNAATVATFGIGLCASGQAAITLQLAPAARSLIAGLPLLQQAVALAPGNVLRGSPCARQVF